MEGLEREVEFDRAEGVPRQITIALVLGYKINGNEKQIIFTSSLEFKRKETFQEFVTNMEQAEGRLPSVAASGPPPEAINPEEIDDAADEPADTPPVEEVEPEIPPPPPSPPPVKRFETPVTRQNLKQCLAVITDENSKDDELYQAMIALSFFNDATAAQKKEIADAMRLHLRAEVFSVRSTALDMLVDLAGESAIKDIAELLNSRDSSLVHDAIRSLEKIKTKESAQALVDKLAKSDDRDMIYLESALRNMKKVAEGPVLPLLGHEEPEIRTSACKILGEVGGKESYEKLKTLANDDPSLKVRQESREALTKIEQRREQ